MRMDTMLSDVLLEKKKLNKQQERIVHERKSSLCTLYQTILFENLESIEL